MPPRPRSPSPGQAATPAPPEPEVTLDQLHIFLEVIESGGFSAAARRLRRAQSAISYGIATLERQLDVQLFDRTTRKPTLTAAGRELASDARAVWGEAARLRARARGMSRGVEPRLAIAVDQLFPLAPLTRALDAFRTEFPTVSLALHTESLGAVASLVARGVCSLGIGIPVPRTPSDVERRPLLEVTMVHVAAPSHPLAKLRGRIPSLEVRKHVQIVLSERSELTQDEDFGTFTDRTWRVLDLATKHALLRAGLGWGGMPDHLVAQDLASKRLVRLHVEEVDRASISVVLHTMHRNDCPPGPAAQWLLHRLRETEGKAR